ncbi:hypothetical protein VZT92_021083 [Zoarces viviparus]|uniref:Uncharacterized protein n=1 Tax=Zoarces viviparus TaxID=48416 RepID=A0AAW1EGF3_ZOAVI
MKKGEKRSHFVLAGARRKLKSSSAAGRNEAKQLWTITRYFIDLGSGSCPSLASRPVAGPRVCPSVCLLHPSLRCFVRVVTYSPRPILLCHIKPSNREPEA